MVPRGAPPAQCRSCGKQLKPGASAIDTLLAAVLPLMGDQKAPQDWCRSHEPRGVTKVVHMLERLARGEDNEGPATPLKVGHTIWFVLQNRDGNVVTDHDGHARLFQSPVHAESRRTDSGWRVVPVAIMPAEVFPED